MQSFGALGPIVFEEVEFGLSEGVVVGVAAGVGGLLDHVFPCDLLEVDLGLLR